MSNAIREEVKRMPIKFSRLYQSSVQKQGSTTLELKQELQKTSYYQSKKYSNDMQDSLFSDSEFGAEETSYSSTETRVAWINVPENTTEEDVKKKLLSSPKSCIYKILSNSPILTDNQKLAIRNGLKTIDDFALTQAVRYPDSHREKPGELILDANDNIQYKQTYFSLTERNDIDLRGNGDVYAPNELLEEVKGAIIHSNQGFGDDLPF